MWTSIAYESQVSESRPGAPGSGSGPHRLSLPMDGLLNALIPGRQKIICKINRSRKNKGGGRGGTGFGPGRYRADWPGAARLSPLGLLLTIVRRRRVILRKVRTGKSVQVGGMRGAGRIADDEHTPSSYEDPASHVSKSRHGAPDHLWIFRHGASARSSYSRIAADEPVIATANVTEPAQRLGLG
jgi:hypothetical protein